MKTIYMNHTLQFLNGRGVDPSVVGVEIRQEPEYVVLTDVNKRESKETETLPDGNGDKGN